MRVLPISSILIFLTACQPMPLKGEFSPVYLLPLGSELILNRQITIQPNSVSVFLQYGKIRAERKIDAYYPNCKFEVKERMDREQQIIPDHFVIYKIQRDTEIVMTRPIIVAALRIMSDGDTPMAEIFSTTFYIRSSNQPQVQYLTCQHWDDPSNGNYLTIKQVRQALGNIMTLHIKADH